MTEFLKAVDLFAKLTDEDIHSIAEVCHEEHHRAGKIIFEEGWDADRLYIIKKGSVRITKQVDGVGEEILTIIQDGDYFGEMAIIDDHQRSARATAVEDLDAVVIKKDDFDELMQTNMVLANRLLWTFSRILSRRLRDLHDKLEGMFAMTRFY